MNFSCIRSKEERDRELRGTGVPEAVDRDLANIQREYTNIVLPFITRHPEFWNPNTHTLELYTQLVAFVMAYRLADTHISGSAFLCDPFYSLIFTPPCRPLPFLLYVASKSHRKTRKRMRMRKRRLPTHQ